MQVKTPSLEKVAGWVGFEMAYFRIVVDALHIVM
jgi:hypothetical protein